MLVLITQLLLTACTDTRRHFFETCRKRYFGAPVKLQLLL